MSTGCSLADRYASQQQQQQQQQQQSAIRTAPAALSASSPSRGEAAIVASSYHSNLPIGVSVGQSAGHRDLVTAAIASSPASTPSSSSYSSNHPHLSSPPNRINMPAGLGGSDEGTPSGSGSLSPNHQEGPSSRPSQLQYPQQSNHHSGSSINDHSSNSNGRGEMVRSPSGKGREHYPRRPPTTTVDNSSGDDNNCVAF